MRLGRAQSHDAGDDGVGLNGNELIPALGRRRQFDRHRVAGEVRGAGRRPEVNQMVRSARSADLRVFRNRCLPIMIDGDMSGDGVSGADGKNARKPRSTRCSRKSSGREPEQARRIVTGMRCLSA